ncbi:MAG: peptidoglycan DD-metalloendopeptidase family protein [Inhella sp.]|jgi:murein DD-endopeptidase MepM/ murein hydrolase activator NlpD|uniref:M23 family metallopeptidase n=1 Tax=Inhella sp. TaxID=1921806 RepID=UPI0022C3C6C9|nr:M23 family metallopeptidase [Inhella sp.]MCZ8234027.1 peptidoglycan DD-metalloendopeptidase family protein [Inhella sp.]
MSDLDRWSTWLRPLESFAARYPRALTGAVLALLGGSAFTAFALGPLVPDSDAVPRQAVVETLPALSIDDQIEALARHQLSLSRHDQTRPGDSVEGLLTRLGAFDAEFSAFLRSDATARQLLQGRTGKRVELAADANGRVERLVARYPASHPDLERTHFSRLIVERDARSRWAARVELGRYESQIRLGSGQITSTLFAATDEAGLPDAVASQLADMFSGDIDFHRDLRRGDRFSIVFESLTADGEPVTWGQGAGQVLAAEFVNAGRTHQAVWFRDEATSSKGGYYGFDGQSKRRAFLASPMEFSRVSSGFAMRFHPLLQTWRKHNGIDYAAPTGTPVRNVGDGWVSFAGRQSGYGNVVIVRHGANKETLYAHLSRIDVRQGQRVEQGQRLGAVGATGWATGPHLHFEFRVNGQHQDPRLLARASEAVKLAAAARAPFEAQVATARTQLTVASTLAEGVTGRD